MMPVALLASLVGYSIVVSQPLAYLLFLGGAQRALSGAAYVELRQRINPIMNRRVPVLYVSTLVMVLFVTVLAFRSRDWSVAAAATVALASLLVDIFLMLRENAPINGAVDRWSVTEVPDDWEEYRTRWFAVFASRQVVLSVGFFGLLVGAVLR